MFRKEKLVFKAIPVVFVVLALVFSGCQNGTTRGISSPPVGGNPGGSNPAASKADGADVELIVQATANTSITVEACLKTATGQSIQYGYNTSSGGPLEWETSNAFSALAPGKKYYIFARSAENADYKAGSTVYIEAFTNNDSKITPSIIILPDVSSATYGDTLADVTLSGGAANVPGTFKWTEDTSHPVGPVGDQTHPVTFWPDESDKYEPAPVDVIIKVNKKQITVIPDSEQKKAYREVEPVITYTNHPALIGTDTFSGSLSKAFGENAGLYLVTLGSLSAGSNYELIFSRRYVYFTIDKAAGAPVTTPMERSTNQNSIIVNRVSLSTTTGQAVEYIISTSSSLSGAELSKTWQTTTTFTGLLANTGYYVYARSLESGNYKTGKEERSAIIMTGTAP
jgi:hypothetical protein